MKPEASTSDLLAALKMHEETARRFRHAPVVVQFHEEKIQAIRRQLGPLAPRQSEGGK